MKTTSLRARTLACALLAGTAYCGLAAQPAAAQTPREHRALDANGVDLTHGDFVMAFVEGSIGTDEAELALVRTGVWTPAASNGHQWDGVILVQDSSSGLVNNNVFLGSTLVPFRNSDTSPDGSATLTGGGSSYVYTSADGTEIHFGDPTGNSEPGSNLCNASEGQVHCSLLPLSISSPEGKTVTIAWDTSSYCPFNSGCTYYSRMASISNSFGYRIALTYAGPLNSNGIPTSGWFQRTGASFHNDAVSTTAVQASTGYAYPVAGVTVVTDTGGREWRFAGTANGITGIRRPGATADTTSIAYSGVSVSSVTNEGVTTSYSRLVNSTTNVATMTVTQVDGDPNTADPVTTVISDLVKGRPASVTDPLGHTTGYEYDSSGRLQKVTAHEGNYVQFTYDDRGNVIKTEAVPKSGSGPRIVTVASFDPTCSNPVTCNQPNSTTDARGNVTTYNYNPAHGGVERVTGPAPGAVAPETGYSYTLLNGEYRLTGISTCRTLASCAGTADEVKSSFNYDINGNLESSSTGSGDSAPAATVAMDHDAVGNLIAVDGPLTDSDDTVRYRYNSARQLVGTIGPDPDPGPGPGQSGPLRHRAVRNVYTNGLLTRAEVGNVEGQSDPQWEAFTPAQAVETEYDVHARPVKSRLTAGGTTHALSQTHYDPLGRVDCVARRMDVDDFGSSLPDACTPTSPAGGEGADRIVKTIYDRAGRPVEVISAVGAGDIPEITATYTANGLVQTVKDGESRMTTFDYDGHDRLEKTFYPDPNAANTSSTGDYEQTFYESLAGGTRTSGLVASFRNRADETIVYTYDALGRLTNKNMPGSELDVSFGYDLLGQMISASQAGNSLTFGWDALGRNVRQTGASGDYESQYDPAGRRIRLDHPDSFFVTHEYLVTGEMTAIRENGGTLLATFDYDQLGRRDRLVLGNGAVTDYQYDGASRLWKLIHDPAGSAHDNEVTFAYNPAGQIVGRTAISSAYAWTGHGNGSTVSSFDGLNRLVGEGHDARSNRTTDGTRTYVYDSENKSRGLATAPYHYDPLGRLSGVSTSPGTPPALAYESYVDNLIAERFPGASVSRRHVFGPGVDEPLVWYEGSGTTDRRFLQADERGSIVAVSDGNGVVQNVNRYDEYGRTQNSNNFWLSRFGFTGQRYFSGHGLYHYKNRMYDPKTGRFMQPDPIGYGAGMNLYAYVKGDPINFTDPLGLDEEDQEIVITGKRLKVAGCSAGFIQIGSICASGANLSTVTFSGNSFSFTTAGVPDIGPGTDCTAQGNIVTCSTEPEEDQCTAPQVVASYGISGSAAAILGVNGSLSFNIGIPTNFDIRNPLKGIQLSVAGQGGVMAGYGIFAGVGEQMGIGYSSKPLSAGFSTGSSYFVQADAGGGPAIGGSGQVATDGSSAAGGLGGKIGLGIGLYVGGGKSGSVSFALPPIGC